MADFPATVFVPRTTENLSGVTYDPAKTTEVFAEDYSLLGAEIVALEEQFGVPSTVEHILTASVSNGGTGYSVGDFLILTAGNSDAYFYVGVVTGGVITDGIIVNGGTGYSLGTSPVVGGTGADDAVISIDSLGVNPVAAQALINMPAEPTVEPFRVIAPNGYFLAGFDTEGRFAVGGPVAQVTMFDQRVGASVPGDALPGWTLSASDGLLHFNWYFLEGGSGQDFLTIDHAGNLRIINTAQFGASLSSVNLTADRVLTLPDADGIVALETSASDSFTTVDGKTVTVVNGLITSIV